MLKKRNSACTTRCAQVAALAVSCAAGYARNFSFKEKPWGMCVIHGDSQY